MQHLFYFYNMEIRLLYFVRPHLMQHFWYLETYKKIKDATYLGYLETCLIG